MTSKHYKQILVKEYETQELSTEDFKNTLEFYTELVKKENSDIQEWSKAFLIIGSIILISVLLANLVHLLN